MSMRRWRAKLQLLADEVGGGKIVSTNGGHLKICLAVGGFVYVAGSPSDHRVVQNIRRDLRRVAAGRIVRAD